MWFWWQMATVEEDKKKSDFYQVKERLSSKSPFWESIHSENWSSGISSRWPCLIQSCVCVYVYECITCIYIYICIYIYLLMYHFKTILVLSVLNWRWFCTPGNTVHMCVCLSACLCVYIYIPGGRAPSLRIQLRSITQETPLKSVTFMSVQVTYVQHMRKSIKMQVVFF